MGTSCKIISVLILLAFLAPLGSVAAEMETSMSITAEFKQVHVLELTMDFTFSDDIMTVTWRMLMDTDADGTVSAAEVEAFEETMKEDESSEDVEINMTLDGSKPTSIVQEMTIEGAEGANDSTADITFKTVVTATYPEPADADTHTYAWPEGEGWSGDDGDDPWENMTSWTYKLICPDGWVYDTEGWPAGASDFLSSDGTTIEVGGAQKPANFDTTIGTLESFKIKKDSDGDDDDSPGFGLVIALAAVGLAALAVRRRR